MCWDDVECGWREQGTSSPGWQPAQADNIATASEGVDLEGSRVNMESERRKNYTHSELEEGGYRSLEVPGVPDVHG